MKKSFKYVLYIVSFCVKFSSWSMSTQGSKISMITNMILDRLCAYSLNIHYVLFSSRRCM